MMRFWYAIYTKPKKEYSISRLLSNAGIEVFLPQLRVRRLLRGKRKELIEPLFPCYIFALFKYPEQYRLVRYTRGVRNIVGVRNRPIPVDASIISMIEERLVDGVAEIRPPEFKKGDRVEVTDGPFQGLMGIFEKEIPGRERALIFLDTIMQAKVEVDRETITRAC